MCDEKMLKKMRHLQIKPPLVICTNSSQCWCNEISFKISFHQHNTECMSPQELLDSYGKNMNLKDKRYLMSLTNKEFIYD